MEEKTGRYGVEQRRNIENPTRINIILPEKVCIEARKRAFERNISMGKYLSRAIVDFMNREAGHDSPVSE